MANKLEDLVRVATVLTRWLVTLFIWSKRQRELQQQTPLKSLKLSFIWEPLKSLKLSFNLRVFEVFEALFSFESFWSLWNSFNFESVFEVFEALFYLKAMPNSQIKQSFKGVTIATSRNKENFQGLVLAHL